MLIPPDHIREWLSYDPDTGIFRWKKVPRGCHKRTGECGGVTDTGYVSIFFEGKRYQAHRLAWWLTHGWLPVEIDHKNTIRTDNRLANLRPANSSLNKRNRAYGHGVSGYKGVSPSKTSTPWRAYISPGGRQQHLGHYHTAEDAARAYDAAARKQYGEYARCNFGESE
jgi:hypothetical protein